MRTRHFYLAMFCAAGLMTSCGNDKESAPKLPQGTPAKLELTIEGTTQANGRATGTLPADDNENEKKINTLTVAVFKDGGAVNTIKEFSTIPSPLTLTCLPGNNQTVYVIANAKAGTFAGVATKSDFEGKLLELTETAAGQAATGAQLATNLPMAGELSEVDGSPATTMSPAAGGTVSATVKLSRLVARVSISSVKSAFDAGGQYNKAKFEITDIYLKNANSKSTVKAVGSVPVAGDGTVNKYLYESIAATDVSTGHTTPYWFYTFANADNSGNPTKLIIKGKFYTDGTNLDSDNSGVVYYPITINKKQNNTSFTGGSGTANGSVDANQTYALTATIKTKGVLSDTDEIDPASITLTVSVESWKLDITQDVTFE